MFFHPTNQNSQLIKSLFKNFTSLSFFLFILKKIDSSEKQVPTITFILIFSVFQFVTFSSGFGDREIRSARLPIEVFSPLRLVPQEITLPVGAIFQVTPSGGPQQDFSMEYVSTDSVIARVNPSGLIEAQKVGDVVVTGMAVSQFKSSRNKVVYSKDEVNVHVIQLEGVKIHCPLVKIKVGCQMPLWAAGVPQKLSPLVLGSMDPPLVFKWTTSTTDVIELREVFHSTGVEVGIVVTILHFL